MRTHLQLASETLLKLAVPLGSARCVARPGAGWGLPASLPVRPHPRAGAPRALFSSGLFFLRAAALGALFCLLAIAAGSSLFVRLVCFAMATGAGLPLPRRTLRRWSSRSCPCGPVSRAGFRGPPLCAFARLFAGLSLPVSACRLCVQNRSALRFFSVSRGLRRAVVAGPWFFPRAGRRTPLGRRRVPTWAAIWE